VSTPPRGGARCAPSCARRGGMDLARLRRGAPALPLRSGAPVCGRAAPGRRDRRRPGRGRPRAGCGHRDLCRHRALVGEERDDHDCGRLRGHADASRLDHGHGRRDGRRGRGRGDDRRRRRRGGGTALRASGRADRGPTTGLPRSGGVPAAPPARVDEPRPPAGACRSPGAAGAAGRPRAGASRSPGAGTQACARTGGAGGGRACSDAAAAPRGGSRRGARRAPGAGGRRARGCRVAQACCPDRCRRRSASARARPRSARLAARAGGGPARARAHRHADGRRGGGPATSQGHGFGAPRRGFGAGAGCDPERRTARPGDPPPRTGGRACAPPRTARARPRSSDEAVACTHTGGPGCRGG
jgi:hypothetical protein